MQPLHCHLQDSGSASAMHNSFCLLNPTLRCFCDHLSLAATLKPQHAPLHADTLLLAAIWAQTLALLHDTAVLQVSSLVAPTCIIQHCADLETGALSCACLLLHGHNLHDLVLQGTAQEILNNLVLLHGHREQVNGLQGLDLALQQERHDCGLRWMNLGLVSSKSTTVVLLLSLVDSSCCCMLLQAVSQEAALNQH
jgi:hypothetical protein